MTDLSVPAPRARFTRIASAGCLILISALVLIDHIALSHFQTTAGARDKDHTELGALQTRVEGLEQTLETLQRQPATVTPAMLQGTRSALLERLVPLERLSTTAATKDDVAALQNRVGVLEGRLRRPKPVAQQPGPSAATAPATPTEPPPFAVLGAELRGGERFLSVAMLPLTALAQVVLMRVGDPVKDAPGEWRLESLEGSTAVFRSGDRLVRVSIP